MKKQQLRQYIRGEKVCLLPHILERAATSFASQADAIISRSGAKTILLYASLPDEVPTLQFIAQTLNGRLHDIPSTPTSSSPTVAAGSEPVRIVLPCVVDDENLELRVCDSIGQLEVRGKYKIPEPVGPLFHHYDAIDLAFVPGMAFDMKGHRLGRGKGYYDRLLARVEFRSIPKIGVCFDFQMFDAIPSEPHDCTMDHVITIPTQ